MSGGHFDYNQYKIGYIADEVEQLIDTFQRYFNNLGMEIVEVDVDYM